MLSENLRQHAVATAVEAFDADAVTGGTFDRGELMLVIATPKIVSICGFLKYDQKFVRPAAQSPLSIAIPPSTVSKWFIIYTRWSRNSVSA